MTEALAPESVSTPAMPAAEPTAAPSPAPTADGAPAPEGGEQKPPSRLFTQDDVDKIITKRLTKAQRAWERQHQQTLETVLSARPQTPQPQGEREADGAPDPTKYTDYTEYLRDVTRYETRQTLRQAQEQGQRMTQQEQAAARQAQVKANLEQRFAVATAKYDDFEDVVTDPSLPITAEMAEVIADSDIGGELAYHLGKNPAEAARIARLSPLQVARELGKIEAKLASAPPPPQASSAPAPVTPVKAASPTDKDPARMTDAEFAAWRQKQIKARNGR